MPLTFPGVKMCMSRAASYWRGKAGRYRSAPCSLGSSNHREKVWYSLRHKVTCLCDTYHHKVTCLCDMSHHKASCLCHIYHHKTSCLRDIYTIIFQCLHHKSLSSTQWLCLLSLMYRSVLLVIVSDIFQTSVTFTR